MIKKLLLLGLILGGLYAIIFLLQLWFGFFSSGNFIKLSITFIVFAVFILLAVGIFYTIKEDEELKKDNYIA